MTKRFWFSVCLKSITIFEFLISMVWLLGLINIGKATPYPPHRMCDQQEEVNITLSQSPAYYSNLDRLLSSLSHDATRSDGFGKATEGRGNRDQVYGLYLCRGDTTPGECRDCIKNATTAIRTGVTCPNRTEAILWYGKCLLRYANQSFFGAVSALPKLVVWSILNISEPDEPDIDARALIHGLATEVPNSPLMYCTKELNTNGHERYSLAQCTRDLNATQCSYCLKRLIKIALKHVEGKVGWRILHRNCILRYENFPFYRIPAEPQPPVAAPLPHHPNTSIDVRASNRGAIPFPF